MTKTLWCSLLAAGALGGCASTREVPPQLISARQAQAELQASDAEEYAPAEYDRATRLLMAAECSHAREQDEDRVARRACQARQEAQAAQATAEENRLLAQSQQEALKSAQSEAESLRQAEAAARATAEEESRRLAEAQEEARRLEEELGFQQTQKGRVLTMTGTTLFGFDSDQLLRTAERKLDRVAEVLSSVEEPLILEGYTDSVGNAQYNEQLSERRATAVKDYLVARGVDAERIRVEARGELDPVAPNDSPEGRALNRRVELVLPTAVGGGGQEPGEQPPPGSGGTGGSGAGVEPMPHQGPAEGSGGSGGATEPRPQQVPAEGTGGSGEDTRQDLQEMPLPRSSEDTGGSGPVTPLPGEERQPGEAPREPLRGVEDTGGSGLQPLEPLEGETVGGRPPPPGIPQQDLPPAPGQNSFEEDSLPMD